MDNWEKKIEIAELFDEEFIKMILDNKDHPMLPSMVAVECMKLTGKYIRALLVEERKKFDQELANELRDPNGTIRECYDKEAVTIKSQCADDLKEVRAKGVGVGFYDDMELDKLDKKWRE